MIAWAESSFVAVIVAVISLVGALLGGGITYLLKQQDRLAAAALVKADLHQAGARDGISAILAATSENTTAILGLQQTFNDHLAHHLTYEKVH